MRTSLSQESKLSLEALGFEKRLEMEVEKIWAKETKNRSDGDKYYYHSIFFVIAGALLVYGKSISQQQIIFLVLGLSSCWFIILLNFILALVAFLIIVYPEGSYTHPLGSIALSYLWKQTTQLKIYTELLASILLISVLMKTDHTITLWLFIISFVALGILRAFASKKTQEAMMEVLNERGEIVK